MACVQLWVSWSRAEGGLIWCHERAPCTNYSHLCLRAWATSNCAKAKGDCVILGGKKRPAVSILSPNTRATREVMWCLFFPSFNCKCGITVGRRRCGKPAPTFVCSVTAEKLLGGSFFAMNLQPFGGLCNSSTRSRINASHCLSHHWKHEGNVLETRITDRATNQRLQPSTEFIGHFWSHFFLQTCSFLMLLSWLFNCGRERY